MKISYHLDKKFTRETYIATGVSLDAKQTLEIDPVALTPDQRKLLLEWTRDGGTLTTPVWDKFAGRMEKRIWETSRQFADVPALLAAWEAEFSAAYNAAARARIESAKDATQRLTEYTGHPLSFGRSRPDHRAVYADYPGYNEAVAAAQTAWDAAKAREESEARARREATDAAKAALEADKRTWCAGPHASDHLRRAVTAGYDCQRRYATERAAVEYPGYVVDFDDNFSWKSRSCPSPEALAEAERVGGEVVWVTDGPDVYGEIEAIVIRGYLGGYDLVKL